MTKVNKENMLKWVEALESGNYKQGEGVLRERVNGRKRDDNFCCLGVGCDIAGFGWETKEWYPGSDSKEWFVKGHGDEANPPEEFEKWLGIEESPRFSLYHENADGEEYWIEDEPLAGLNDDYGLTFGEIAQLLRERYLEDD